MVINPKNKEMVRMVCPATVMMQRHRDKQTAERVLLGRSLTAATPVFERVDGSMILPNSLSHLVSKMARKLGYEGISVHSLRHSFATMMLRDNIHPAVVQHMLGHSTVTLTLDTYSHPGLDLQRHGQRR